MTSTDDRRLRYVLRNLTPHLKVWARRPPDRLQDRKYVLRCADSAGVWVGRSRGCRDSEAYLHW